MSLSTITSYDYIPFRINYQEKNTNSTVETVIHSAKHPFGIAVDNLNSKIYWSDSVDKSLSRSELNGSNLEVLLKDENFGSLGGISLDTVNRFVSNYILNYFNNFDLECTVTMLYFITNIELYNW